MTLWVFVGMGVGTAFAIVGVNERSFPLFFGSFMAIFLLAGMGNGSTYRMIPCIFAALGRREAEETGASMKETALRYKRQAAAVIGIAGAIGAFGGFLIQVVLRQASLGVSALVKAAETPAEKLAIAQAHADWSVPALWVFLGAYVVFAGMTWFFYLRKSVADGARAEPRVRVGVGRLTAHRLDAAPSSAHAGRGIRSPSSSSVLLAGALNFDTVCGAYVPRDPSAASQPVCWRASSPISFAL